MVNLPSLYHEQKSLNDKKNTRSFDRIDTFMEASNGFEPMIWQLQCRALPLGYEAFCRAYLL